MDDKVKEFLEATIANLKAQEREGRDLALLASGGLQVAEALAQQFDDWDKPQEDSEAE